MPKALPSPPISPATEALTALRVLVGALTRSARGIEEHTGITNAQLFILRQLGGGQTLSINDLAARAHTRQNTVSSVVGRLARQDLVENVRAVDDGRRAALSITPRGRRLLSHAPASPTEGVIDGLESMTSHELKCLTEGLNALLAALDVSMHHAPMLFEEAPSRRRGVPRGGHD